MRCTFTTFGTPGHYTRSALTLKFMEFPRREHAGAKIGPRLEVSPIELQAVLNNTHGLSSLITSASSWDHFAWKGNDLSAPLRALYAAEGRGLLSGYNGDYQPVSISDITAEINTYLISLGKKTVSEHAVMINLKKASLYINAGLGVWIAVDNQSMTVRLVNAVDTSESIKKYFIDIEKKLKKLNSQVKHAESCGYDVSNILSAEQVTGAKMLAAVSQ